MSRVEFSKCRKLTLCTRNGLLRKPTKHKTCIKNSFDGIRIKDFSSTKEHTHKVLSRKNIKFNSGKTKRRSLQCLKLIRD